MFIRVAHGDLLGRSRRDRRTAAGRTISQQWSDTMTSRTPRFCSLALGVLVLLPGCGVSDGEGNTANSTWVGHTYLVTPADPYTYLTKPSSSTVAKKLADFVPNFLLRVNGAIDDKVSITVAPAKKQTDPPEQDLCNATVEVEATVPLYPSIHIGPTEIPLYITSTPQGKPPITGRITVKEFSLTDLLPNGSEVSESGRFSALVDAREANTLATIQEGLSAEDLCLILEEDFATECVPCPDSQVLCMLFEAEEIGAIRTETEVKPMAESDLDSSCPQPS